MGLGAVLAVSCYIFTGGLLIALVALVGADYRVEDIGDAFAKLGAVAQYADERLQAASTGQPLPEPPQLLADPTALRLGLGTTLVYEALLVTVVGGTTQQTFRGLVNAVGLNRFNLGGIWVPALCVIGAYLGVGLYVVVVKAIGVGILEPTSTVPGAIVRDNFALAVGWVVAVIAAPVSEELFFRGFVFGGLLRWGYWPAAAVSALGFSLAHFDPGSVIPFFCIGLVMAWLYWRRGSLWDSITFHFLFNFISFALLMASR